MNRIANHQRSILMLAGVAALLILGTASTPAHGEIIYLVCPHGGIEAVDTDLKDGPKTTVDRTFTANGVTFNIDYLDGETGPAIGFADPNTALRDARRQQLENVLNYIAEVLNLSLPSALDIEVRLSQNIGAGNFLAFAGTFYKAEAGFQDGSSTTRLLTGTKPFQNDPEIVLTVDFGHNWNLTDQDPAQNQADFFSTILHEIIHGLGLTSLSSANGVSRLASSPIPSPNTYTVWDSLMVRGSDFAALFGGSPTSIQTSVGDLTSGELFYDGDEGFAQYGQGVRPPIYAPPVFSEFSSLSHWDSGRIVGGAVMEHEIIIGRARRTLSPVDLGAIQDLGFTNAQLPAVSPRIDVERSGAGGLTFGDVTIGSSASGFWTVTNTGGGTLTGSLSSDNAAFTVAGSASYSLGAGQETELQVLFTPPSQGQFSATLTFSGGSNGPIDINVTGGGVSAGALSVVRSGGTGGSFGSTQLGAPVDVFWVVTNTGGSLLDGGATIVGQAFSIVGSSTFSLSPQQSDTIQVRFSPPTAQAFSGTLTITGGDGDPVVISLTGTGTQQFLVCNSATVAPGGGIWGDAAVLALALLGLAALARTRPYVGLARNAQRGS